MAEAEGKTLISTGEGRADSVGCRPLSQLPWSCPRIKNFCIATKKVISKLVG